MSVTWSDSPARRRPADLERVRPVSARQRLVVLTFATIDDAERFDVEAEWYGAQFAIADLPSSARVKEQS